MGTTGTRLSTTLTLLVSTDAIASKKQSFEGAKFWPEGTKHAFGMTKRTLKGAKLSHQHSLCIHRGRGFYAPIRCTGHAYEY